MPDQLIFVIGLALVVAVSFDVFQTIIVPRITSTRLRIGPYMLREVLWPIHKQIALPLRGELRETWMEMFAPLAFVIILLVWFVLLIGGFALMLFALRASVSPPIPDLSAACYFAGTSVMTLGFGDLVATHWTTRILVLSAAMLGLIFMALEVSHLFVLQTCLQQREQVVYTLTSRAGSPASGLVLLLRYKELNIVPSFSSSFVQWESWVSAIVESHRAYPLLLFFRSSDRANSWVSSLGAILDAGTLLSTSVEDVFIGEAELFYWLTIKTLKSVCDYFELSPEDGVHMSRTDYDDALELLRDAGFATRESDKAWHYFSARRGGYMRYIVPISRFFMTPQQIWMIRFGTPASSA